METNLDLYIRLLLSLVGVFGTFPLIVFFWKKRKDPYIAMFVYMKIALFLTFLTQIVTYVLRLGGTIENLGYAAYVYLIFVNIAAWHQMYKLYLERKMIK